MKYILSTALIVSAALASAQSKVDLKFVGTGSGRSDINLKFDGHKLNAFVGQLEHKATNGIGSVSWMNNQVVNTYCAEATQTVTRTYETYTATNPGSLAPNIWAQNAGKKEAAINQLYKNAGGKQSMNGVDKNFAAAFQLAVWKIAYDFNGSASSLNFNTGRFQASTGWSSGLDSSLSTNLNGLFAGIGNGGYPASIGGHVLGLANGCAQDQLVDCVPEPASLAILGLGAFGFLKKKRKK